MFPFPLPERTREHALSVFSSILADQTERIKQQDSSKTHNSDQTAMTHDSDSGAAGMLRRTSHVCAERGRIINHYDVTMMY